MPKSLYPKAFLSGINFEIVDGRVIKVFSENDTSISYQQNSRTNKMNNYSSTKSKIPVREKGNKVHCNSLSKCAQVKVVKNYKSKPSTTNQAEHKNNNNHKNKNNNAKYQMSTAQILQEMSKCQIDTTNSHPKNNKTELMNLYTTNDPDL